MEESNIGPTDLQTTVLRYRGHFNILSAGGRGSGKTFGMMLAVVDHMRLHQDDARPLVTREQWLALQEIQTELLDLCRAAFGLSVPNTHPRAECGFSGRTGVNFAPVCKWKGDCARKGPNPSSHSLYTGDGVQDPGPKAVNLSFRISR